MLNLGTNRSQAGLTSKLALSGVVDKATQDAIDSYQRKVMKSPQPDGRVDTHGGMIRRLQAALPLLPSGSFSDPLWLKVACEEEKADVKELAGRPKNTPRILEYLSTAKGLASIDDTTTIRNRTAPKKSKRPASR